MKVKILKRHIWMEVFLYYMTVLFLVLALEPAEMHYCSFLSLQFMDEDNK